MKKVLNRFLIILSVTIVACMAFSCHKQVPYDEMSPEQQQKEYIKFQKDSIKTCTENLSLAKSLILEAFDRDVNYSKKYKKEKTAFYYEDSLKGWTGIIKYHVSNGNVYSEGTKVYHLFIWYENNGLAKDGKVFYTIRQAKY